METTGRIDLECPMLRSHTQRYVDAAVDELKRDGYVVLLLMLERVKDDEPMTAMEVLCSETSNPLIIQEMAKEALKGLSQGVVDGPKGNHVN
jgi:hypothetical protein